MFSEFGILTALHCEMMLLVVSLLVARWFGGIWCFGVLVVGKEIEGDWWRLKICGDYHTGKNYSRFFIATEL